MITLTDLISECELLAPAPDGLDVPVTGITDDSRDVSRGDLFVAVTGAASDGHRFAEQAVAGGAVAVLAERPLPSISVPVALVSDLKRLRGTLAARVFGHPSAALEVVGVTGTNGKTSIACFIAELAMGLSGRPAGYMGTIGWGASGDLEQSNLTTASAITIQRRLARFRDQGFGWAVLEASSHALDQHRLDGVALDYAVFSNLSRDHLDYHGDFDAYGRAKARLFRFAQLKACVINVDDPFGLELARQPAADVDVITCGRDGDISWEGLSFAADGIRGHFHTPWGDADFELPLYGSFSVANVAAAVGVLCHAGFELPAVVQALATLSGVPGRMEFFAGTPTLVVDYAHTPDALEKMLEGLRPHAHGRLVCVCGCGGGRDRGKRPLMARAACAHADRVWLTSDNPRNEDPAAIIDEMLGGVPEGADVRVKVDRAEAIRAAFCEAEPEDLIVVAGKGHEDYQEVAGQRLAFSDRQIAARLTGNTTPAAGGC
jgi:UDP-N-acetylmuramoyl-L-alanyl-D-glutamate--2,6-diaminopimelate ligase